MMLRINCINQTFSKMRFLLSNNKLNKYNSTHKEEIKEIVGKRKLYYW